MTIDAKQSGSATLSTQARQPVPSPRMLRAALSGLMAASAFGCSDESDSALAESADGELSNSQLKAMCADMVADAKASVRESEESKADEEPNAAELDELCADRVKAVECPAADTEKLCKAPIAEAVKRAEAELDTTKVCADTVKEAVATATAPKTPDEKTTNSEQKEYTFAELTKMCDERGGYVQVHGACGGHNSCQGFSYGDWGPGAAMLTEHSCTGVNGCQGLSCVVLPEDKRKDSSGAALYDLLFADTEPSTCTNCHTSKVDDEPQLDTFVVHVPPGSTRTEANWLDRSAAEQERVVAFGAHSILGDGIAMQNMAAYNKVLSRAEVERLIAHIRTLKPVVKVMKTKDPASGMSTE